MHKIVLSVAAIFLFLVIIRLDAQAGPIIRLVTAQQFQTSILEGRLTGVTKTGTGAVNTSNLAALQKVYPGQSASIRDTIVYSMTTPIDGLISRTGSSVDKNLRIIGAWSYTGPDPDYTGAAVQLDLYFPQVGAPATSGIDTMAFTVIDTTDRVKLWRWDNTVLTTGAQSFDFDLDAGAGAGGSTSFLEDPGFDLTHSALLQVSYRGTLTDSYPLTPPTLDPSLWLGTDNLVTAVPEPGCLAFLAVCVVFVGLLCRQRNFSA